MVSLLSFVLKTPVCGINDQKNLSGLDFNFPFAGCILNFKLLVKGGYQEEFRNPQNLY